MLIRRGFSGPIFIVGIPRSGTKLLRDLLNRHSDVAIPVSESHFIPYYFSRIGKFGDLSKASNFEAFYIDFSNTVFFQRLAQRRLSIPRDVCCGFVEKWTYPGIIEGFYRAYAWQDGKSIWGDKTPAYLVHLPLLYSLFPEAKVIHIIRDPRDTCVSIHRIWGKNIYRAAQKWHDNIEICRKSAIKYMNKQYLEIKYEDLLQNPTDVLTNVCQILDIEFEHNMLGLEIPVEKFGDTHNCLHIVNNNYGKYKNYLTPLQIATIEAICGRLMHRFGYLSTYSGKHFRINRAKLIIYRMQDGLNLLKHHYSIEKDISKVLRLIFNSIKNYL
jgi:hypothetical protein